MTTRAPSSRQARVIAAPMPEPPPVTTMSLSLRPRSTLILARVATRASIDGDTASGRGYDGLRRGEDRSRDAHELGEELLRFEKGCEVARVADEGHGFDRRGDVVEVGLGHERRGEDIVFALQEEEWNLEARAFTPGIEAHGIGQQLAQREVHSVDEGADIEERISGRVPDRPLKQVEGAAGGYGLRFHGPLGDGGVV